MRRFLRLLAECSRANWEAAARAYVELQSGASFRAADRALGQAIEAGDLEDARDAVVGPIVQIALARTTAPSGPLVQLTRASSPDETGGRPSEELLAEVALGAALALVARGLLAPSTVSVLYEPFARFIPIEEPVVR